MARVLVVDDAAFVRLRTAKVLSDLGHEVVLAENGRQAVALYQQVKPDAVLMDVTMPEMNGLQALEMIRAFDPSARVAMVSAQGERDIVIKAIKSGAMDFVVKPIKRERIVAAIERLLVAP
jgi:two-component system chemotaxis response regulator CheY